MKIKLLLLLFLVSLSTYAQYTTIPDVNFENKLIALEIDSGVADGQVLTSSISSLTSLDVSSSSISDLTGIQDFVALTSLDCSSNQLTALDISKNTAITMLYGHSNQLISLDVSNNLDLIYLDCTSNKLTSLDISKNVALTAILCYYNQITTIDVSKNIALRAFNCSFNQLTSLDVSNNLLLDNLSCSGNQLTALDVSKNLALTSLLFSFNQLTSIDVSKNVALQNIACRLNQLSALDVSNNLFLVYLVCDTNQLTNLDLSKNVALDNLFCFNNQLTSLDLSKNVALVNLDCSLNNLSNLNLRNAKNTLLTNSSIINFSGNPNLTCIQVDDATYSNNNWAAAKDATASYSENCDPLYALVPDSSFEQKLIDLGFDTDGLNGKITIVNLHTIVTLDLSNSHIKDLTGIGRFTELNVLYLDNNELTDLDLSKNTNLQVLHIKDNPLVFLNLQNGNNKNLIVKSQTGRSVANAEGTSFLGITTLGCIKVDDAAYSNANWSDIKEPTTLYSETCTLGLEDSEFNKAIVCPNPTKGELNILNIALEKATVYNALGQLVRTFTLDSGNTNNRINLSGLPKGVYFVYLINQDAASAKKVIVE